MRVWFTLSALPVLHLQKVADIKGLHRFFSRYLLPATNRQYSSGNVDNAFPYLLRILTLDWGPFQSNWEPIEGKITHDRYYPRIRDDDAKCYIIITRLFCRLWVNQRWSICTQGSSPRIPNDYETFPCIQGKFACNRLFAFQFPWDPYLFCLS